MDPIIWAAVIAGGVSVIGNGATVLVSIFGRGTLHEQIDSTESVELAKVNAEAERVRDERREQARRERRELYARFLTSSAACRNTEAKIGSRPMRSSTGRIVSSSSCTANFSWRVPRWSATKLRASWANYIALVGICTASREDQPRALGPPTANTIPSCHSPNEAMRWPLQRAGLSGRCATT